MVVLLSLSLPPLGEGGPAGPDEGQPATRRPFPVQQRPARPSSAVCGRQLLPRGRSQRFFHLVRLWTPVPLPFHHAPASTWCSLPRSRIGSTYCTTAAFSTAAGTKPGQSSHCSYGFPLWGKLSPQVTDEGEPSGHFPLIRRAGAPPSPQGEGFIFALSSASPRGKQDTPRFRRLIRLSPRLPCRLPRYPHRPQRYRRYPPRFAAAISDTPRWRAA